MNRGDFQIIYEEHEGAVYRWCRSLCGDPVEAEDLAQETFVFAFRSIHAFKGRATVKSWLFTIARNCWRRRARSRSTVPLQDLPSEPAVGDPTVDQVNFLALESAVRQLPQAEREAFVLVRGEGLDYRQAADVLGCPVGTVKWRVHKAMTQLREILFAEPPGSSGIVLKETGP